MSSLNSKLVKRLKPSKKSNLCTLHVKGDWNDADYITEDTKWTVDADRIIEFGEFSLNKIIVS